MFDCVVVVVVEWNFGVFCELGVVVCLWVLEMMMGVDDWFVV